MAIEPKLAEPEPSPALKAIRGESLWSSLDDDQANRRAFELAESNSNMRLAASKGRQVDDLIDKTAALTKVDRL